MSDVPWVVDLRSLGRSDLPLAGGKGANLGELLRGGFPVPPGFVITTAAYDSVAGGEISADLERRIVDAYQALGGGAVAVRSSATAEDLPQAAFAGQHDTLLNVLGPAELLRAVQACWASLSGERAVLYRQRQGFASEAVKLAVVVQRMVNAEFAGVMFTANPVTGERWEIVIDGTVGLGEAVVSGLVTPDQSVLRRRAWGLRIAKRRPGRREVVIRARPDGGTEQVSTADAGAIPDETIRRLGAWGERIARHFGSPQDIEWTVAGGEISIVQARPITALPAPRAVSRGALLVARMVGEMLPVRPYPLDLDVWIPGIFGAAKPMFAALGLKLDPLREFVIEDGVVLKLSSSIPLRPTPALLLAPLRLGWLAFRYDSRRAGQDPTLLTATALARSLEGRELSTSSWSELLDMLDQAAALPTLLAGEMRRRYAPCAVLAVFALAALLVASGRRRALGALLSGTDSLTSEANRGLEALAEHIRRDPALKEVFAGASAPELASELAASPSLRTFLAELARFLQIHGHREAVLSTAAIPTWKDDRAAVLGVLKGLCLGAAPTRPALAEWELKRGELLQHSLLGRRPLRGLFQSLLSQARSLFRLREDSHYWGTLTLPTIRRVSLELGRRLVEAGARVRVDGDRGLVLADVR